MATRKIELMHELFGTADGKCVECCNLLTMRYHDKTYRKCKAYGVSRAESTDWAMRYQACGLKNRKIEQYRTNVVRLVRPTKASYGADDGQLCLEVNA